MAGALLLGSLAAACGSSGETGSAGVAGSGNAAGSGGSSGAAGSAAGGAAGSVATGCVPACVDPQICSVENSCIDPDTCLGDGDCGTGLKCDTMTNTCVPGGDCGGQEAKADPIAPNLLVVLDRSCSMTAKVGDLTKWDIAVQALNTMTTTFKGKIRFGLTLFPDLVPTSCAQDAIAIPVGVDNEMAIQTLLTASLMKADPYFPDGPCVTNIDTAVDQANIEPALTDMDRESYVLLITDGKQSGCNDAGGDAGTEMIIKALHDTKNVPTFVLGFGDGVDPAQMNLFAAAGGVPASMNQGYYDASDQASLDAALQTIADKTLGCTFKLDEKPPSADDIFVFFNNDKKAIPRDLTHMQGWDYDPITNQVTFYGGSCDDLKAGTVVDVDIVFGCDEPTPT